MSSDLQTASRRDLIKASEYYHQGDAVNGRKMWTQGSVESCGTVVASNVARYMSIIKGNERGRERGRDYFNDTNGCSSTSEEKARAIDLYLLSQGIFAEAAKPFIVQVGREQSFYGINNVANALRCVEHAVDRKEKIENKIAKIDVFLKKVRNFF